MAQEIAVQILPPISGYPMSLNTQMKALKCLRGERPIQVLAASQRAEMALRQTHILERALKAGEPMPGSSAPWSGRSELLSRHSWDYCAREFAGLGQSSGRCSQPAKCRRIAV